MIDNKIVLISGKQGSGKTTLVAALQHLLPKRHVTEFKFASTIYQIHNFARMRLRELRIPIPEELAVKDGPLLQLLGTEWGRQTYGADIWVKCCRAEIEQFFEYLVRKPRIAVVSDCRFKNEFEAFPNALRVRLECPKLARKDRCEQWRENDTHPSEIDLDDHVHNGQFDMIFDTQHATAEQCATLIAAQLDKNVWLEKRGRL